MQEMNEDIGLFAQQEQEAKRQKKAELLRKEVEKAIIEVMSTQQGRKVLAWVLTQTGYKNSVSFRDPMTMAMASGKRDVGLIISEAIEALCPQSYLQMQEEEKAWMNQFKNM